jgi:signal transduction histidine kinase
MINWLKIAIIISLLFPLKASSQNHIDSLENLVEKTKNIEDQYKLYISLSELYLSETPSKSFSYQQKALKIATQLRDTSKIVDAFFRIGKYYWYNLKFKKLSDIQDTIKFLSEKNGYDNGLAGFYRLEGLRLIDKDSLDQANNQLKKAIKLYNNAGNFEEKAHALLRTGIIFWRKGNYDSTLQYYSKAKNIFDQLHSTYGLAKTERRIGIVYKRIGDYPRALDAFYRAEKLFEQTGIEQKVAEILGNIGDLHIKLKNYKRALKTFNQSLDYAKKQNNKKLYAFRIHNIGHTYYKLNEFQKADSCFNEAYNLYEKLGFTLGKAEVNLDMGKLFHNRKMYERSNNSLSKALPTFNNKMYERGLAEVHFYMAKNYYELKEYSNALNNIKKGLNYNDQVRDAELEKELYKILAECQSNTGNFYEAYHALKNFHSLHDSLTNIKSKERIAKIQSKYQTEKKEREIENLIKEKKIENQKFQRNFLLVTFILVLIIAFLIYIGYRNKKKHLKKLQKTNEEMKEAKEKAEQADKLKSTFLANISHEIRTPMNAIVGFSDLIEDADLSKAQREDLISQIKQNSNVLLNLIDDLIDFSKIESGEIELRYESIFLNELMDEIHKTFYAKLTEQNRTKDIEFDVEKPQPDVFQILTDRNRLKQILYNLIDNAFKFTEKGYIRFGYYFEEENPGFIHFFVKDTGVGIPKDKQKDIFRRFSKYKQSKTKHYAGTGLGLTITKALINKMGGSIRLISEKNQGTEFYFYFPLKQKVT